MKKHDSKYNLENLWHNQPGREHPMKGRRPWNKGLKVDRRKYPDMGHFQKHSKESIKKMLANRVYEYGEKIKNWKGDNVGYQALHDWVKRWKGKAEKCVFCGSESNIGWSNISYFYKRHLGDWESLCHKCHMEKDRGENRGKAVEKYGK